MTDNAISVHNVSKRYHVYENQRARLRHALWPSRNEGVSEVWALRDINFEVKQGDSIAIIGRNGSGKSTLLEIITQTLTPTTGKVQVNGRVAALLELGSGFKPDYTGQENVFLNGLLLGLTRAEIERHYDEIVSFADIGDVLDRPVKTYSSGMLVRLAFAVQVALEPDILIVDEALSVGDYFFQQKCFGHLRKMRENGLTLLFVSHDMGTVRDLCKQAIYLRNGMPLFVGDSRSAIQRYFNEDAMAPPVSSDLSSDIKDHSCPDTLLPTDFREVAENAIWSRTPTIRDRLLAVQIFNEDQQCVDHARIGETIRIHVFYRSMPEDEGSTVTLAVKNRYDQIIFSTSGWRLGVESCDSHDAPYAVFSFEIDLMLEGGLYSLLVGIGKIPTAKRGLELDTTDWFGPVRVDWNYEAEQAPFLGMFGLPARGQLVLANI